MKLLNSFGVTSSVFHTRKHGSFRAKVRKVIDELNPIAFWQVTFDNLDFRIKFAKKLSTGGHLKRMLHLLTSQVSFLHTYSSSQQFNDSGPKLKAADLKVTNFTLDNNSEWLKLCSSTYRANESNEETEKPLLSTQVY